MDRMIFRMLLLAVAIAPIPFGAALPWAWSCMALLIGLLMVAWSLTRMTDGAIPAQLRMTAPVLLCMCLLAAWIGVQAIPDMAEPWRHPLWQGAAGALESPTVGSISMDPGNAMPALVRLGAYAGIFWLATQYGREATRAKLAIAVVAMAGSAYALYGLTTHFLGSNTILWFEKDAYAGDLTSTFVNRNNYATYAGLGCLCQFALFFRGLVKRTETNASRTSWLRAVIAFVEQQGWIYLLGTLLLASALLTSHSRGGLLSTVFGLVVFLTALLANRSYEKGAVKRFSYVALALLTACVFAGGEAIEERLAATGASTDERAKVYALTADAIRDRPVLGTGVGTFEEAFRLYRTSDIKATFAQAHNTYLETALELGIPGCALIFSSLFGVCLLNVWGAYRRQRDAVYPCLGLGVTSLVAAHASVDFSIQIPAVAATYALILGICFSQSWSSRAKAVR